MQCSPPPGVQARVRPPLQYRHGIVKHSHGSVLGWGRTYPGGRNASTGARPPPPPAAPSPPPRAPSWSPSAGPSCRPVCITCYRMSVACFYGIRANARSSTR
eukprot:5791429-Pyramimonas_sp.AAC.1